MADHPGEFNLGYEFDIPPEINAPLSQASGALFSLQEKARAIAQENLASPAKTASNLSAIVRNQVASPVIAAGNTLTALQRSIEQYLQDCLAAAREIADIPLRIAAEKQCRTDARLREYREKKANQPYDATAPSPLANYEQEYISRGPADTGRTETPVAALPVAYRPQPQPMVFQSLQQGGPIRLSCERVLQLPADLPPLAEVNCVPPPMPDDPPNTIPGFSFPAVDVSAFYSEAVGQRFPWLDEWIRRYIRLLWFARVVERPDVPISAAEWQLMADIACSPAAVALQHGIQSCFSIGQQQPSQPAPPQSPPEGGPSPLPPDSPQDCKELPTLAGYQFRWGNVTFQDTDGSMRHGDWLVTATVAETLNYAGAKSLCESCGGQFLRSSGESEVEMRCVFPRPAGQPQPQPPATIPEPQPTTQPNCCCCNCQHSPSQDCPAGTVKIDGVCKVPDSAKKWVAYYSKGDKKCYTIEAGQSPRATEDILSGTGDTREAALLAAGDICKPIQSESSGPPLPKIEPPVDEYCQADAFVRLSQAESQEDIKQAARLNTLDVALKNWKPFDVKPDPNFRVSVWISDSLNVLGNAFKSLITFDNKLNRWILEFFGIKGNIGIAAGGVIVAAEFLKKYIGGPWDYLITPAYYLLRRSRPMIFPSVDEARKAFLTGRISEQVFRSWCEINGHCYHPQALLVESQQALPGTIELIQMLRRGLITPAQFTQLHQAQGMIQTGLINNLQALGEAVPAVSDLTRFMVRDVEDTEAINRFGMDDDFDKKFQGEVKKWAAWQGVEESFMRRVWRAHWSIPSPGQLFAMWHRNGRKDPSDPAYVSYDDVKAALIQQDILPFWVPKILATSYSRLTRVDVRRAFDIGAIDRGRVLEFFKELGYDDENAELLTKFTEKQRLKALRSGSQMRDYLAGVSSENTLRNDLAAIGVSQTDIIELVEYAKRKFKRKVNARCLSHIRKRSIAGELDEQETIDLLTKDGYDGQQAQALASAWKCESVAIGKEFSASQILKYLQVGLISPVDAAIRLAKIGYSTDDATRMITDALRNANIKLTKQQEAMTKAEQARLAKEAREREKTHRQIEQQSKAATKARLASQSAIERRDKALLKSSQLLANCIGISLVAAYDDVRGMYQQLRKAYPITPDDAMQAIISAIEICQKEPSMAWDVRADLIAARLAEPESASSNGSG